MIKKLLFLGLSTSLLIACQNPATEANQENNDTADSEEAVSEMPEELPQSYEKGGLKIYPKTSVKEFAGAKLSNNLDEFSSNEQGEIKFDFGVEGYELGAQTTEAGTDLANSDKGQHIHLIVDNGPYSAHYEPSFSKAFPDGPHYAIAFLSRSYHESVKNPGASVVFQFNSGSEQAEEMDLSGPLLFYSRPKGTYSGKDANKILFDFYLANTKLSADKRKVAVTVNDSLEFAFDKWQPYIIEGLPAGENTIEISLLDENGNDINPDMNRTVRKFTLEK